MKHIQSLLRCFKAISTWLASIVVNQSHTQNSKPKTSLLPKKPLTVTHSDLVPPSNHGGEEEADHHNQLHYHHPSNSPSQKPNPKGHKTHVPDHPSNPPLTSLFVFICIFLFFKPIGQTSTSSHFAHPFFSPAPMAARAHGPLPPLRPKHLHGLRVGFWPRRPLRLQPRQPQRNSVGTSRQGRGIFSRDSHR